MHADDQCSLPFRLHPGHVLLALEGNPVAQMLWITTPAGSGLHEADTVGDKGLPDPLLMLRLIKLWKTEPQVNLGDMASPLGKAPGGQANVLADPELEPPGQPGAQVHGSNGKPGGPVARMSERVGPVTLGHPEFIPSER